MTEIRMNPNNTNEIMSNATVDYHYTAHLKMLFISTSHCERDYSSAYCGFAAFIILLGYLSGLVVFPFMLYRMRQLKKKFRNHYNVSLLWLNSIMLVFLIDLIEYFLTHDGTIYSSFIILSLLVYIATCVMTIGLYVRDYSIEGSLFTNVLIICFSNFLFALVFISRILSQKSLAKFPDIDQRSAVSFHIINTHFFMYFFVYVLFACVQIYQNFKNKCARCLTNWSYAAWILSSFMLSFYSDMLPKRPAYDYIHYRNYFLMTTIIVIMLQDINFLRLKLESHFNQIDINSISMKQMNRPKATVSGEKSKKLTFVDQVFNDVELVDPDNKRAGDDEEDEDSFFDLEQYNLKGTANVVIKPMKPIEEDAIRIRMHVRESRLAQVKKLINDNQTVLMYLFVALLLIQFIYTTVLLLKSVTFSHFAIISPLVHPAVIMFALIFKNYSCKF